MTIKIGALFAGYGGLELGILMVYPDAELAWYSEIDPRACRVLERRFPGVPNIGDITQVDWAAVEPVDVLAGGFPCQDLSDAGQKAGLHAGTRSGLWIFFANAIAAIRPQLVIFENVRGLLNADAHSEVGGCPTCLESLHEEPGLRALGFVLGDLAQLRYDAAWHGLRAAEVGPPHGRFRVFGVAWPSDSDGPRLEGTEWSGPAYGGPSEPVLLPTPRTSDRNGAGRHGTGGLDLRTAVLMPTPRASDGIKGSPNQHGSSGDLMLPSAVHLLPTPGVAGGGKHIPEDAVWSGKAAYKPDGTKVQVHIDQIARLLPTPTVVDMGGNKTPEEWDEWTEEMRERHNNGLGHGDSLNVEVQRMLPTPDTTDGGHSSDGTMKLHGVARADQWGEYAEGILLWESLFRPAPSPTEPGPSGPRLNPQFSEWMMGLPEGWVTDPGLWDGWRPASARNAQLHVIGNGVVPQQAAAGIKACLQIAALPVESAWEGPRQRKAWTRVIRKAVRQ